MNPYMTRERLLSCIEDCLETNYDFKVTQDDSDPCDELFKLEVHLGDDAWIPIIPTESVTVTEDSGYSVLWESRKGQDRTVKIMNDRACATIEEETYGEFDPQELVILERSFCIDFDHECKDFCAELDWGPSGPSPFFTRFKSSVPCDEPEDRGCPSGCGRVLRYFERHCPNCVLNGEELYPG